MTSTVRLILGIIMLCTIYMIPFGIALLRNRENKLMICILNILGFTMILWIVAFFMSLKARDNRNN